MSIEADILLLLKGPHAGASAVYGDRVYPDIIPQDSAYPVAVYELDSDDWDSDFDGDNGYSVSYATVTIYALRKSDVASAAEYIRTHLHGFTGSSFNAGSGTVTLSSNIAGIFGEGGASGFDPETKTFSRTITLEIHTQN